MSEIRQLLAAAQEAEVQGNVSEATRLLRAAADWYDERNLLPRADQMRRHIDRLNAKSDRPQVPRAPMPWHPVPRALEDPPPVAQEDDDRPEFDQVWDLGVEENTSSKRTLTQQRRPLRAPADSPAWCSFCCRPQTETGPLIAGPQGAGAFICAECLAFSTELLGGNSIPQPAPTSTPASTLLPQQAQAAERLRARRHRVALVTGPEATGKTTLLRHFGGPHLEPWPDTADLLAVDLAEALSFEAERRLLAWLDAAPHRQVILSMRGLAPTPALVLQGLQGPEPLYDSAGLKVAAPVGSDALLTRIDLVIALDHPGHAELEALAVQTLKTRGVDVPDSTRRQLIELALKSSRPVAELLALINRIPPGSYQAP